MWHIDLNVSPIAQMLGPQVRWIEPLPAKLYEGGDHGMEWTWLDKQGDVEARVMCKAGVHTYARTPRRTCD